MAERAHIPPAPRGEGWVELHVTGEPEDVWKWDEFIHDAPGIEVGLAGGGDVPRDNGLLYRRIRARLLEVTDAR